jgi:hypothetical protein
MKQSLVITTISNDQNPILKQWAKEAKENDTNFILIGDKKSPVNFDLKDCDYYSADKQNLLGFELARVLPFNHYARKNIGYLLAMARGSEVIIESDDDNRPREGFWDEREKLITIENFYDAGWINVYDYFSDENIWARGFPLELVNTTNKAQMYCDELSCPIQQGLVNENPDVDAIYRMTGRLPITFYNEGSIALAGESYHPFNSQNTTWFKEAFPLLYIPYYCSFRMCDIWRSFVAQRICQEYDWGVLYHGATVIQERNDHNLMNDFRDEIPGYLNNVEIMEHLQALTLTKDIYENLKICYKELFMIGIVEAGEMQLLSTWINDIKEILK